MRHHRGRGVRSAWGGLLCLGILLLSAGAAWARPAAYLRSTVGAPWGVATNEAAMNNVLGTGNWDDLRYETVSVVTLLSASTKFIYMEGSDSNANELEAFLNANRTAIENWVSAGGRLFLNAAPNEGDGMLFGFGGVTLVYPSFSGTGVAFNAFHPIFGGPFTPVSASYTGNSFSHGELSGGGTSTVMTGDGGRVVLAEKAWGSGRVLFGGMTTDNFQSPQPDAANLRANIIHYTASNTTQTLTGGGPGGSAWYITNTGGTSNALPTGGSCSGSLGLTVQDASLGGTQFDAVDNGLTLWVNDVIFKAPPVVTVAGQTYTAGPVAMAGLNVTMQYSAASQSATLRTLATFQNPSAGAITVTVKWLTNVGSDGNTGIRGSSNGDTLFTSADRWVVTSDSATTPSDPVNTHVLFGPGTPAVTPTPVSQTVFSCAGTQGVFAQYSLPVPAGATRLLLFFNQLNSTNDAALTNATTFDGSALTPDLLAGLSGTDLGQIVNWQITLPDLTIDSIALSPPPVAGQTTTVTVTARNQGTAAAGAFYVDFYKDRATAPGPLQFGDVACFFNGLAAGATVQCVQGAVYATPGSFSAWAQVDADQIVTEVNETNNVLGPQAEVVKALLTVSKAGTGTGTVTSSPAGISCDATCPSASAAYTSGTQVTLTAAAGAGSVFQGWSGGGCSGTGPCVVTLNANTTVTVTFDAPPAPDLVVQSIVLTPATPIAGQTTSVTVTARNQGAAAVAGTFFVDFYQDRTTPPGLSNFGSPACSFNGLAAGATVQCTGTIVYASPGTFSAWGQVDADGIVAESNEANNVFGPQTVTVKAQLTVTKAGTGSGTVASSPDGLINCGATCTATYTNGTTVTLTATPAAGSAFAGWSGEGCGGTGTCVVAMTANRAVTATFVPLFTLTVSKSGTGGGTVTSSPAGINCGADCSEPYASGTQVTLAATPAQGSVFSGWSGGGCGGTGSCVVTVIANTTVTATFVPQIFTLTVQKTGSGTVTSSPDGITCGQDCTESYANGTAVTLTATPAVGFVFQGWSGGGCSGTGTCVVTISAATTVSATFVQQANLPKAAVYLRSTVGLPFSVSTNEAVMDAVFGAGNWSDLRYETVDPGTLFTATTRFVFMEGSDTNADELETFLSANRTAIESWVSQGGRLLLNAAPNEGNGMDFGFGGVALTYPSLSGTGVAFDPFHPIFSGPLTPVATSYTGTLFARADVAGGGAMAVMTGDAGRIVLAEKVWGTGRALFGGMTTSNLHLPQPDATNLRANIIAYTAGRVVPSQVLAGGGPGASQWFITNSGGTSNGLPTGGFCSSAPGLTVQDASVGGQGDAFDNGLTLWVNDAVFVAPPIVTRIGPAYTAGPATMAGLNVTVQYYAASQSATLRTLASFQNPTGGPIAINVKWLTNVGSDGATVVRSTSSGDTLFTPTDRWVVTSDSGPFDAVNTHVLFGPGMPTVPPNPVSQVVFDCFGTQGVLAQYGVTVPAGESRSLLFFNQLNPTVTAALTNATTFDSNTLPGDLLAGLAGTQLTETVNWAFPAGRDLVVESITMMPAVPVAGQPVTVTVTARNQGILDVLGSFAVDFYMDRPTAPGVGQFGDAVCFFNGVAAGGAVQCVRQVTYPMVGTFTAWAQVDADGIVPEANEINNVLGPRTVTVQNVPVFGLQVTKSGNGTGTVTSSPTGISCGVDCSEFYASGTQVTLTATPAVGFVFQGWSGGGCSGTGNCVVTLGTDTVVTATFTQQAVDLVVDSIVLNPASPVAGETATVTVTARNQGATPVTGSFAVDFYRDRPTAPGVGQFGDAVCFFNDLAAGGTVQCVRDVVYSSPGTFSAWAQVDADGIVAESNETNNVRGPQAVTVPARLNVTKTGTGTGTVTSNPAGISCGVDCTELYTSGTPVTLTAAPAQGSTFGGWSGGGCSGTGPCVVTLTATTTVTASFVLQGTFTLTVAKAGTGSGVVTSAPVGISCGADCSEPYASGTVVVLSPSAATGSVFTGWSGGGCSGTGSCTVTVTANTTVTATFVPLVTLTVAKSGGGSGTVTSMPAGIDCGADCTEPYASATPVTLTAAPAQGSTFGGWSGGGCTGNNATCVVTVTANTTVTATFAQGALLRPFVYLRSTAGAPWNVSTNEAAMNAVFGVGSWDDLRYETVDPGTLFTPATRFIFMEGGDFTANALEAFLNANRTVMESWVTQGGRLFLNAAPNQGDGMLFGFGGVTLIYPSFSSTGVAADPNHSIFHGPLTPVDTSFTGSSFAHGEVSGGGATPVIMGDGGRVVLAEKAAGGGRVLFGGMTTDNFHAPQPNAGNLRANIIAYTAFANAARPFVYLRSLSGAPWGQARNEAAMDAIFGAGNWDDLRYEIVNLTSLFTPATHFIFMEGGDFTANELETFLNANRTALENWVSQGGRLFLNAAPNEGDGMLFGFGGVTLNFDATYTTASSSGVAVDPSHPIFSGPRTPVGTSFTGGFFTHAHVTGGGVAPVIADGSGRNALAQKTWGAGLVLFGGMTTDNFHAPQPNAANLRANIIAYTATVVFQPVTLQVTKAGDGTGTVTSAPPGVNCGDDCTELYTSGTVIVLTATAGQDSIFTGWSGGGCSGTGSCTTTLTANSVVTATFARVNQPTFTLTVAKAGSGNGTVTSNPVGISCGADCTEPYASGMSVTLTAAAAQDSTFTGWSGGACSGTGTCTVTMSANRNVTATFVRVFTLTVGKTGSGSGTVTSNPAGINCGATCLGPFPSGTAVTLTAQPALGTRLKQWTGCQPTPNDPNTCTLTISTNTTVTAEFVRQFTVSVSFTGTGDGRVTLVPGSDPFFLISCPPTCSLAFDENERVFLLTGNSSGSAFVGWSPNCAGGFVDVTQNISCTAQFTLFGAMPASLGLGGLPANGSSSANPALSSNGQFLVFDSDASNLDAGSICIQGIIRQIFVLDLSTGVTTCVSGGADGRPGNLDSTNPVISTSGRYVAFQSRASNLVLAGCTSGGFNIFVRDRTLGTTTCVSVTPAGIQGNGDSTSPTISANGRIVAFETLAPDIVPGCGQSRQIVVRDLDAGQTTCVSVAGGGGAGNGPSSHPSISGDGNFVAFQSNATNLVPMGCVTPGSQIFVRARATQTTTCISVDGSGGPGDGASDAPAISQDGRFVAFESLARNLVPEGDPQQPGGCANGFQQIFLHDRNTRAIDCISVGPEGQPGNGSSFSAAISGTGQFVVFASAAANLIATPPAGPGTAAAFHAASAEPIPQIFLSDAVQSDAVQRAMAQMSQSSGVAGDLPSRNPAISFDGQVVAFQSRATNLMANDTNDADDIFVVRDTALPPPPPPPSFLLTIAKAGSGSGSVSSTNQPGIDCGTDCQEPYALGTSVRLTATPTAGSIFAGWSGGGCSGTGDCVVVLTTGTQVTATFEPTNNPVLSVRLLGGAFGRVTGTGIDCGTDCTEAYPSGTAVELTPVPAPGAIFEGWGGGGCSGTGPCTVTVTDSVRVTAAFAPPGRVVITEPADGTHFPLASPTVITFRWTGLPGVTTYGLEHTGPNLQFSNPNAPVPDPVNGFGGMGGGFPVSDTTFSVPLGPGAVPAGVYQARVIGLGVPGATFSDAVSIRLGPLGPTMTSPTDRTQLASGALVVFAWTTFPGAADYFFEVSGRDLRFTNPNGVAPDPINGSSGRGLGSPVAGTGFTVAVPQDIPPGTYQIRVIGRSPAGQFIGQFSDAINLIIQ